ncbi:MAG: cytochrome P450, CYP85 clan [Monoraphidium minutum]|nr:MAG: cytochrome P450, CYP85 clan [Monoraphidium minutum]
MQITTLISAYKTIRIIERMLHQTSLMPRNGSGAPLWRPAARPVAGVRLRPPPSARRGPARSRAAPEPGGEGGAALAGLPLPEGSLGLPLVGETLDLLRDGDAFGAARTRRYGPLWKTNILGAPTVMVYADADVRSVLALDGRAVESWWPPGTAALVGAASLNVLPQPRQATVKAPFVRALGERAVAGYVPTLARVIDATLGAWADASAAAAAAAGGGGGRPAAGGGPAAVAFAAAAAARRALPLCDALASATFNAALFGAAGDSNASDRHASGSGGGDMASFLSEALERGRLAAALAGGFAPPMLDLPATLYGRARAARRALLSKFASELAAARARAAAGAAAGGGSGGAAAGAAGGCASDALVAAAGGAGLSEAELLDGLVACLFGNAGAGPTFVKLFQHLAPWECERGGGDRGWWARLRQEQRRVVAARGAALDGAALDDMPVAEAVAREALRITPVVPAVFRVATEDFELAGRRVPKGWRVWCHTGGGVLRYNADEFDPSRWLPGGGGGSGGGSDSGGAGGGCPMAAGGAAAEGGGSPFGQGARACVGRPLMMAQLKLLIALLARRYVWRFEGGAAGPRERWVVVPAPRPREGLAGFVLARAADGDAIPVEL